MKRTIAALALIGATCPLSAHEYWLEAPSHQIETGDGIEVGIFVGSDLVGQQMPYFPQAFRSLQHYAPGEDGQFISGRIGTMPALGLADLQEGLHIVAQETRDSRLTYEEEGKFESFLAAEGIEYILDEHRARGLPEVGFSETYSRSAKALIGVGASEGDDFRVGLPVELVALDNPFTTEGDIQLQYFVRGEPASNARINLFHRSTGGDVVEVPLTTDSQGIAVVPESGTGFYLANAVHMDAVRNAGPTAWHSSWASLSWTR